MACQIKRNPQGKIVDVLDATGKSSKLFRDIHGTLFLADVDTSLKIFTSAYSDKIQGIFEGKEPTLNFKTNGEVYDNLEDLILKEGNGDIALGFVHPTTNEFIKAASVNNESEIGRQLTSLVKQGFLSAERSFDKNGETTFVGKGEFATTRYFTAKVAISELESELGKGEYKLNVDGTFTAELNDDYVELETVEGEKLVVLKQDVPQLIKDGKIANPIQATVEYVTEFEHPRAVDKDKPAAENTKTDVKGIQTGLLNFLKSLGFSTVTMEGYRKRYNTKYGKDPDIRALADIANQIVAGDITNLDDLSEEVAHIAIEMYSDQNSIASALASVHNTPEYAEFYAQYKEKYSEFYEGIELEDHVRKEILGKILKKSIQEKFSTQGKTESQSYVIQKLKEIWNAVTKFINSRLTGSHYQTLDILNQRIAESVFNNTSEDFQADISGNENFFYNLMSDPGKSIENDLKVAKRVVEDMYRRALEESIPNPAELEHLAEITGEYEMVGAVNTIVNVAAQQMNTLKINIEDAAKNKELVSKKDAARYQVLKENLIPTINNIKVALSKVEFQENISQEALERIKKTSDEIVVNMSAVEPLMDSDIDRFIKKMVEGVLNHTELTEEQRQEVREQVAGGIKDLNWAGKFFGLATHLKNPLLQLMAKTVSKISTKVATQFNKRLNSVVNEVVEKDLTKYQKSIIKDGTHYFISPINEAAYQKDLRDKQAQIIADIMGKEKEEIIKLREKMSEKDILKEDENFTEYKKQIKEWKETDGVERRFSDQYYKDRDARFDSANTSENTRTYLSTKNAARYERLKKYQNTDGTIDASKQTRAEREQDNAERKSHLSTKNPYDSVGNLKPGLKVVKLEQLTQEQREALPFKVDESFVGDIVLVDDNFELEGLTLESRRALDLFNLDMLYREESVDKTKTGKPLQQFVDRLTELESNGESSYNWVLDNASINLASEYYDNLGTPVSFNQVAQDYIDTIEDQKDRETKQALLDQLIDLQRSRKAVLKQNKYSNSAVETDVHHMTSLTKNTVIELDAEITDTRRALNMPEEFQEEITEMTGESALNEDYQKMLTESGLTEYEFALQNMTERNLSRVKSFAIQLDDIISKGQGRFDKSSFDDFVSETTQSGLIDNKSREEAVQILKDEFAKKHVASYFKRFQPAGYSNALSKLKSGEVKMSDLVDNKDAVLEQHPEFQYIEITPDYSWSEDISNDEYLNPNFKEGLSTRPRLDRYLDDEFFSKYGIKKAEYLALDTDDLGSLTPTNNVEEFEFLKMMVQINEESIELLGNQGRISKYQRPQISKEAFEKHVSVYKGLGKGAKANVKDFFRDVVTSRLDEKDYGEVLDGLEPSEVSVKIVPRYYQEQLEDSDFVTENTFEAVMVNYKAALRYKERINSERVIKALEHKISQQSFKNKGSLNSKTQILKKGAVSNYYQKAQEMADYHLYGIRQNRRLVKTVMGREIDLTQIFGRITKYVANVNLGFSPIVDLTSYTTGVYNNMLDRFGGDFYGAEAANKSNKVITKMITNYVGESGKLNKQSDLNHLMEFFRVFEAEDRLQNSSEGRALRIAGRTRFALSKLANLPVTPRNMLAVLYDHKFVDGTFISFRDFHRREKTKKKTISSKEVKALWKKNTDTLYSNLEIDPKKGVMMGEGFRSKFGETSEQEFNDLQERLIDKIAHINQSVDSIISETDKTMAQRDVLLSSMMLHRSWMVINLTRKFKGKHFNIATGQIEEGQYNSAFKVVTQMVKAIGKKGAIKEVLRSTEEYHMRNAKRTMAEMVTMGLLIGLTKALLAADDEDDTFVENLAQLIALRTTSESQSASFIGMLGETASVYEDPLIQVRYLENMKKGFTKDPSYFLKNTYYKRYSQFSDMQKQVEAYQFFNQSTLVGIGAAE